MLFRQASLFETSRFRLSALGIAEYWFQECRTEAKGSILQGATYPNAGSSFDVSESEAPSSWTRGIEEPGGERYKSSAYGTRTTIKSPCIGPAFGANTEIVTSSLSCVT